MDATLSALENWGCDVKTALPRLLDDEGFLLECIRQVSEDPAFAQLGTQLAAGNATGAFEAAHSLKGITANTGITPVYDLVVELVEPLRHGSTENLQPIYEKMMAKREELLKLLG